MKIDIKRSGGLAGIEEVLAAGDSRDWPAAAARGVRARVDRLLRMGEAKPPAIGADLIQYELTVTEADGKSRKLVVADEGDPEAPVLKELLALVESIRTRA
jgi:hypothetical protein